MSVAEKPEKKRGSAGRILLIISLAANLFLLGLLAGGWASGFRIRGPMAANFMQPNLTANLPIRQLARQLPDATRLKLHDALVSKRKQNRTITHDLRQSRRAVFQALEAEPFDVGRLGQAFTAYRQADLEHRELSHQVLLDFLDSLDEQERAFVIRMVLTTFERGPANFRPNRQFDRKKPRREDTRTDR